MSGHKLRPKLLRIVLLAACLPHVPFTVVSIGPCELAVAVAMDSCSYDKVKSSELLELCRCGSKEVCMRADGSLAMEDIVWFKRWTLEEIRSIVEHDQQGLYETWMDADGSERVRAASTRMQTETLLMAPPGLSNDLPCTVSNEEDLFETFSITDSEMKQRIAEWKDRALAAEKELRELDRYFKKCGRTIVALTKQLPT